MSGYNNTWLALEPYIERERELRGWKYQEYFEDLVVRIRKNPPEVIRKRLNLQEIS